MKYIGLHSFCNLSVFSFLDLVSTKMLPINDHDKHLHRKEKLDFQTWWSSDTFQIAKFHAYQDQIKK